MKRPFSRSPSGNLPGRGAKPSPAPLRLPANGTFHWKSAVAGALLGMGIALVLFAPARWLAGWVHDAGQARVLLAEPRGTVWTGSAQMVLSGGAGSRDAVALPGRTEWQLRPTWTGVRATLQSACCMAAPLQANVRLGWNRAALTVGDHQSHWPAALLDGLGTPWNTLQLRGQLALATQGVSLEWAAGRLVVAGQARLDALQVSSRLSTLQPMGSYRVTIDGGTAPALQLQTLDGSLQLAGRGSWVGGRLRFQGEASAAPEREAALTNLLNIIGRRQGARSIITVG